MRRRELATVSQKSAPVHSCPNRKRTAKGEGSSSGSPTAIEASCHSSSQTATAPKRRAGERRVFLSLVVEVVIRELASYRLRIGVVEHCKNPPAICCISSPSTKTMLHSGIAFSATAALMML